MTAVAGAIPAAAAASTAAATPSSPLTSHESFILSKHAVIGPVFSVAVMDGVVYCGHHNGLISGNALPIEGQHVSPLAVPSPPSAGANDAPTNAATAAVFAKPIEIAAHLGVVRHLLVWEEKKLLFSCSIDGTVKAWSLPQCIWSMSFAAAEVSPICSMALDKKKGILYTGNEDGAVALWDTSNGALQQSMRCHVGAVTALVVPTVPPQAADGGGGGDEQQEEPPKPNTILTASSDSSAKLLEPSTKLVHLLLKAESPVCALAYVHPVVLCGCSDGVIRGFHIHTANPVVLLRGHTDSVNAMVPFSRGRLISSSDDMTVIFWNLPRWTADWTLRGHDRAVTSLACGRSDDCSVVFTAGFDGVVNVWDAKGLVAHLEATGSATTQVAPKKKATKSDAGKKKKK